MNRLPIKRDLTLAYTASLVVAALIVFVSAAGLLWRKGGLYGAEPTLVQVSAGGDVANLVIGLPFLLGSMWLARRGSLLGLLLWPGALFYVLYIYALYLVGAPLNALFLPYVALVTLSVYIIIGLVASIDGEEVRQRFVGSPARIVGGALVGIAVLAYAALTFAVIATLTGSTGVDPMHPQWIVDYTVGNPVLLLGGVLLWRRERLGYVAAVGLLLLSGINGVTFAVSEVIGARLVAAPIDTAVIAVHLVISTLSFALLVFFVRGAVNHKRPVVPPITGSHRPLY